MVQYVDDTLLIMPAYPTQVQHMKCILLRYAESIGLQINFHKSTLIPINMNQQDANHISEIFGCTVGAMPFTYLGLPVGTTRPTVADLMPMVVSMERRLSATNCLLPYGAKLTLVNSVLTSLVIYAMCTLRLPPRIVEYLDKLRRTCLWRKKTDDSVKCNSLAAWDLICRPKDKGGLGGVGS